MGTLLGIVIDILIGALVGWIAGILMKSKGGFVRNAIMGIVGGFVAGLLPSWLAWLCWCSSWCMPRYLCIRKVHQEVRITYIQTKERRPYDFCLVSLFTIRRKNFHEIKL